MFLLLYFKFYLDHKERNNKGKLQVTRLRLYFICYFTITYFSSYNQIIFGKFVNKVMLGLNRSKTTVI